MPPKAAPKAAPGGQSSSKVPQKRKSETQGPPKGDNSKKAKNSNYAAMRIAREIPGQAPEAALNKDGELDVQSFVSAQQVAIRSLEQSMATAKSAGTSRAFQQVPRGLRRRTAAHNPRRVPKRLQARARKEMKEDNTPLVEARKRKPRTTRARIRAETAKKLGILAARQRRKRLKKAEAAGGDVNTLEVTKETGVDGRKKRPKIRRNVFNEPEKPPAKFRKRQINKTWLPTHAWHAKRARMTEPKDPLWRFAVPLTPNEKIYRPTHRAQGNRGALVWDMSYMSTIRLDGYPSGIARTLRGVGVSEAMLSAEKGRRWRAGCRSWTGWLTQNQIGETETRHLCPATILWNPVAETKTPLEDNDKETREVFLRVHPSAFLEVFNELLEQVKLSKPRPYIEDLRYEIGSIELTGPASTEVLHSILHPYQNKDAPKSKHAKLFQAINGLTNPSTLPANAMLGFSIQDPRLRYPPRRATVPDSEEQEMELLETIASWPADKGIGPYGLFDRNVRHTASVLPSQQFINRRRSKISPGAFLKPSSVDPAIPIVLLATRSGSTTQTQGTWTILAPWKCILPIWYSTIHCPLSSGGNPRFAGLNEIQQVAFERGLPWFPADFPFTNAGINWELEERRKRMKKWIRRPRSKRVAFHTLDRGGGRRGEAGDGFACDWEHLFALDKESREQGSDLRADTKEAMTLEIQNAKQREKHFQRLRRVDKAAFDKLCKMKQEDFDNQFLVWSEKHLLTVKITMLSRGTVGPCARIYRLPSNPEPQPMSSNAEVPATIPPDDVLTDDLPHDIRQQWLSRVPTKTSKSSLTQRPIQPPDKDTLFKPNASSFPGMAWPPPKANTTLIDGVHPIAPDGQDLIGFVTTGSFDLSQGRGTAIGSLAVSEAPFGGNVLNDVRADKDEGRLCIVRNAGEPIGWIARWEAI